LKTREIFWLLIALAFIQPEAYSQRKRDKREANPAAAPVNGGQREKKADPMALFLEGEKQVLLGDAARAVPLFRQAAELDPSSAGIRYKWAMALTESGKKEDTDKALTLLQEAIQKDGSNRTYYLAAAGIKSGQADYAGAAALLEKMIALIPDSEEHLYELASYYQYAERNDKALDVLERTEKHFGLNENTIYMRVEILESMGKADAAEKEIRKMLAVEPDEVRHVLTLAEILANKGDTDGAIACLQNQIKEGTNAGYARAMLSELYFQLGKPDEALGLAAEVMADQDVETGHRIALVRMFLSATGQSKTLDAVLATELIKLLKMLPAEETPAVAQLSGDIYAAVGDNREAERYYRLAIRQGANEFTNWINLFNIESGQNHWDSLVQHSEEALEYYPNLSQVWFFNGLAHFRKKNYTRAAQSLEQVRKLGPEKELLAESWSLLGESYQALKQYDRADQAFEAGLSVSPDHDGMLNNYSYYLALRKHNLTRAEELSRRLVRNHPNIPTYTDTFGWVLFMAGKYAEARSVMEPIIRSGKASATHVEHYGDILFMSGDTDGAVRNWELALSMNSQNDALRKKILNRKLN